MASNMENSNFSAALNISLQVIEDFVKVFVPVTHEAAIIVHSMEIRKFYQILYEGANEKFTTYPPVNHNEFQMRDNDNWLQYLLRTKVPMEKSLFETLFTQHVISAYPAVITKFILFIDQVLAERRKQPIKSLQEIAQQQERVEDVAQESEEQLPESKFKLDPGELIYIGMPITDLHAAHERMKQVANTLELYLPPQIRTNYYTYCAYVKSNLYTLNLRYHDNDFFWTRFGPAFINFKTNYERLVGSPMKIEKKKINLVKNLGSFIRTHYMDYGAEYPKIRINAGASFAADILYKIPLLSSIYMQEICQVPCGKQYIVNIIWELYNMAATQL